MKASCPTECAENETLISAENQTETKLSLPVSAENENRPKLDKSAGSATENEFRSVVR